MVQIFLDCDGVLANFDKVAEKIFGMPGQEFEDRYGSKAFWNKIRDYDNFFRNLPLMDDAMRLFSAVQHLNPIILTGAPHGTWAPPQKLEWASHHFPTSKMIVCQSRDKYLHMKHPGDILVDDFLKHSQVWIDNGGIFVHHTNAENSINKLKELGIPVR